MADAVCLGRFGRVLPQRDAATNSFLTRNKSPSTDGRNQEGGIPGMRGEIVRNPDKATTCPFSRPSACLNDLGPKLWSRRPVLALDGRSRPVLVAVSLNPGSQVGIVSQ